ncbi:Carboxylesterase NlhH [Pleurostoma richardsiae]|uniref:Carboxylesterase NlhH n=1 Tax=Pleurostoma richardsiae TaxID=41990 RepID=A0AA38RRW5_9PEZI|nr:Carboxylesterase NlhH [Pleurostoma richardsiae]
MDIESLVLEKAPPLDPEWLQYEQEANLLAPKPAMDPLERQPIYAAECRILDGNMMAPGARDHHLSQGITTRELTVPSSKDGFAIPVLRYDLLPDDGPGRDGRSDSSIATKRKEQEGENTTVVVYYHGGGLHVGEADSEDLQCRRILKDSAIPGLATLYSVGYRLRPTYPARTCVSDSLDALLSIRNALPPGARVLLVGSSSGGELAALVSQQAPRGSVQGVALRCPVTSDAFSGEAYVPSRLRRLHTSAWDASFETCLLGAMRRDVPRDGLERMPLEAGEEVLRGLPRTWVQVCTNDVLYSDGVCYAKALGDAGVEVKLDVVRGWPHTFWLKAPQLPRALEADRAMLRGLAWVAGVVMPRKVVSDARVRQLK